jgi:hypothetical protein
MSREQRRDERGTATAFVIGMAITLLVLAGLVVDGGHGLNARMTLADDVEAAAIAGAQAVDEVRLRGPDSEIAVDRAAAEERARDVLGGRGYENIRVSATEELVTVTAEVTVPTIMLSLIGINEFTFEATATADAEILYGS